MHDVVVLNRDGVELMRHTVGSRQGAYKAALGYAYRGHVAYCCIHGRMTVFRNHAAIFPVANANQFELPLVLEAAA